MVAMIVGARLWEAQVLEAVFWHPSCQGGLELHSDPQCRYFGLHFAFPNWDFQSLRPLGCWKGLVPVIN